MKSIYWRPKRLSAGSTLAMGATAVLALMFVEASTLLNEPRFAEEKQAAVELGEECRATIRQAAAQRGFGRDPQLDPHGSGMIGLTMSSITSKPADLAAKQISLHPQFPAALVEMLHAAEVQPGDTVAVGWSGSFPGMNAALAAALEVMRVRPIAIHSVMASQFGANRPDFVWLDMERELSDRGLISFRSVAASIGGPLDRGHGMSDDSRALVLAAIHRHEVKRLSSTRLAEAIDARMESIRAATPLNEVAAYINVGGGIASCGGSNCAFAPGLNFQAPKDGVDCVMQRLSTRGIPVIHLAKTQRLASAYGLDEEESWDATMVHISPRPPSRWLAAIVLVGLLAVLKAFILTDTGHQFTHDVLNLARRKPKLRVVGQADGPQLMV